MIVALLAALAAAASSAPPPGVTVTGGAFVTAKGAPLYLYANDTMVGMSHCSGACAVDYPPLLAPEGAKASGDWSLVEREGGARQWAYRDKPLYTSIKPAAEIAKNAADGGYWKPATPAGAVSASYPTPMAVPHAKPQAKPMAMADSSQFACEGNRRLVAQFTTPTGAPVALVDAGDGPHALALQPWKGGEPNVTWSDGVCPLTWSTGVKLMWMDAGAHLACGRAEHHH